MTDPRHGTDPSNDDLDRYRRNLRAEVESATLYRSLAEAETQPEIARVYGRLAETELRHAAFWEERLREAGAPADRPAPGVRTRILAWLARRFGPAIVLPTLAGLESVDSRGYAEQPESRATALPTEERSHRRVLDAIRSTSTGLAGEAIARLEGRHRTMGGNALRAAVLGANDGLVSNLSLVMGVAGASLAADTVLLTGLAGLLAGSISMALGEWLSVQSSRELHTRQLDVEAAELEAAPEEEATELALIYQAKGLPEEQARELAARLVRDEATALDTLAREELGIDPGELGGSAWEAAGTSFLLFAVGAVLPLAGFALVPSGPAVAVSLAVSAAGLFLLGAATSLMTGRSVLLAGLRQVLFGLAAAGATFGLGRLFQVTIAG